MKTICVVYLVLITITSSAQKTRVLQADDEYFVVKEIKVAPWTEAGYADSVKTENLWYKNQKLDFNDERCERQLATFVDKIFFIYYEHHVILVVQCSGWSCEGSGVYGDFGRTMFFLKTPTGYKRTAPSFALKE